MNQEILERIDTLAAKLGVVGEHLWAVLIKQVYVEASLFAIAAFVLYLVATASFWAFRSLKGADERSVALTIGVLASIIAFFALTLPAIAGLLNPEFYALQKILP